MIGLNPDDYGTHSLRRTKAALIYRQTKNQSVHFVSTAVVSRVECERLQTVFWSLSPLYRQMTASGRKQPSDTK